MFHTTEIDHNVHMSYETKRTLEIMENCWSKILFTKVPVIPLLIRDPLKCYKYSKEKYCL